MELHNVKWKLVPLMCLFDMQQPATVEVVSQPATCSMIGPSKAEKGQERDLPLIGVLNSTFLVKGWTKVVNKLSVTSRRVDSPRKYGYEHMASIRLSLYAT